VALLAELAHEHREPVTEPAVDVTSLSVSYRVRHGQATTLREYLGSARGGRTRPQTFWALRDVSFAVPRGEVLGVVGANGAGKSTLMKALARVVLPAAGHVVVRGRLAPLIELGAGFNPDLTGIENILLYGSMLGRDRSELRRRVDAIAEWAQLGDFIDVPVRTYSAGMLARLGFAVATDVAPDVLIVDEALAVGDGAFRRRSSDRLEQLIATGSAVLLVSHNIEDVRQRSARVLWLDQGQIRRLGDPGDVIDEYSAEMRQRT
jgi:ABC-type polysaccharide/polyol phosphate transport system ATPase subunit